tara:strand:- start:1824 stop:2045 length:222 start_codon:yes stop_codon:yes gene_type:complete
MVRNYKKEYKKFQSSKKSKEDRVSRNKMRRRYLKKGKVTKNDKKDIDHKDGNPKNNSKKNLRVVKRSKNRAKK